MPWSLPSSFRAMKSSRLSVHSLPLELTLTGRPFSKRMVTSWGVDGAVIGSLVLVTVSNQVHLAPRKARVLTESTCHPEVVEMGPPAVRSRSCNGQCCHPCCTAWPWLKSLGCRSGRRSRAAPVGLRIF
jgi:hypothetical protein